MLLMAVAYTCCNGQNKTDLSKEAAGPEGKEAATSRGPASITRNIIQDRKGNIWITSWEGMFRYDGKSFTNVTSPVSSARFFSVLEDRQGALWFGTIGSGVYRYDGASFQHFTTAEGLLNNEIGCMYEDRAGHIWFGVNGGASRYDGKSFRNYSMAGDVMAEDKTGKTFPDMTRPPHEVTSIIEDKTGKVWLGTRDNSFVYDGKTFAIVTHDGTPFKNVRAIAEDKKGRIWLGGPDGLWRYDGGTWVNASKDFVGYVYEDKKGNLWTSSTQSIGTASWALSRYDEKSLSSDKPAVVETVSYQDRGGMLFGILEARDGTIWFGADGAYRYNGNAVIDSEGKDAGQKWRKD